MTTPFQVSTDEEFVRCQQLEIVVYVVDANSIVLGKGVFSVFDNDFVKVGNTTFDRGTHVFVTQVDESEKEHAADL